MNVIVSNKNQLLLENLGIDVIKEMNGEFDVDEIISRELKKIIYNYRSRNSKSSTWCENRSYNI